MLAPIKQLSKKAMEYQENQQNWSFLTILRYAFNALSLGLLIPWYTQLSKMGLLTGRGLQQVAPSLTNLLLYLYVGYPVCVLMCLALSIWLGAKHHRYSALLVSTLPLIYFGCMVLVAKKLAATVTARVQGRLARELIATVPFQYFLPAPLIIPGIAMKGIFRKDA
jgi:hypothetical protein